MIVLKALLFRLNGSMRRAKIITHWNRPFTTGIHTIAINFDGNNYWAYNVVNFLEY